MVIHRLVGEHGCRGEYVTGNCYAQAINRGVTHLQMVRKANRLGSRPRLLAASMNRFNAISSTVHVVLASGTEGGTEGGEGGRLTGETDLGDTGVCRRKDLLSAGTDRTV